MKKPNHVMTAQDLRNQKSGIFSERDSIQECLDYLLAALPREHHAAATTALMMTFNTTLEQLAQLAEKGRKYER